MIFLFGDCTKAAAQRDPTYPGIILKKKSSSTKTENLLSSNK